MDDLTPLLNRSLFTIGDTPITSMTLLSLGIIVVLTFVVSRLVQRGIRMAFGRRGVTQEGTVIVVSRLGHYLVLFVGLGAAIQTAGINLGTLFAAGAVFAVGLGFAMKNIAENFVSGVILLVERAIKPGDVLEVDGKVVRVQSMGIRATIVKTRDGEELILPNGSLVQSSVVNYTLRDSLYRVRVRVGVSYGSDMDQVQQVLSEVADHAAKEWGTEEQQSDVFLVDFGDSSVVWEVALWMPDPWRIRHVETRVRKEIWDAFRANGITIAFPQVDIHLDQPVERALRAMASS